ncbi:MAG: hypothetical protein Q9195_008612 [Heterodermia aff. obscurata]
MALAPKFAGQAYSANVNPKAVHTLELYLDYFSAKMFKTVHTTVLPLLPRKYPSQLSIIFRQQIQPWHPSSTLVHEAGTAVLRLAPDKFWSFSAKLFEQQKDFFDVYVVNETRNQTYRRLAKVAGQVGLDEAEVYGLLEIPDKEVDGGANVGNKVTDDVKLMVKVGVSEGGGGC